MLKTATDRNKTRKSDEVGFRKPGPEIFGILLERNALNPARCAFIDDTVTHCETARSLGFVVIRHLSPFQLRSDLQELGIP